MLGYIRPCLKHLNEQTNNLLSLAPERHPSASKKSVDHEFSHGYNPQRFKCISVQVLI